MSKNFDTLKPCPFCGEVPEFPEGTGSQYEIECGCGMAISSVQICDLMTIEERVVDGFRNFRYGEKYINRAKRAAIKLWNKRSN